MKENVPRLVLISTVAHEIGHLFGLEDEWCSNPAGSDDCRCNDGGTQYDECKKDVNYLDSGLGCDPRVGYGCCRPCTGYSVCCDGNIFNELLGQRSIMSHGSIERGGFDTHSLTHLENIPRLKCD